MKDFVEYVQSEWATIAAAPSTFILAAVLLCGLAYAASRWRHSGIIELLRERIAAKDQQLDEYRERLHLTPAQGSEYSRLSHAELQAETLRFVTAIRDWLADRLSQDSERQQQQWLAMTRASEEEQRRRLWESHAADSMRSFTALKSEYEANFKVRAIVLRDELLSRVQRPEPISDAHHLYEHPTNMIGMGLVADDLERLARLLR